MKKRLLPILITFVFFIFTTVSMAQPKPEEQGKNGIDPAGPPGSDDTPIGGDPGGGAPIDGGLFLLIGLGAAYGSKKVYKMFGDNN